MIHRLAGCFVVLLSGCGSDSRVEPPLRFARTGLVLGTTYETSTVDAFDIDDPARIHHALVAAAGDATLVPAGQRAVVLNRGDASNVQLVEADLSPGPQVALPDCGPHDAVELADGRFLISCYDRAEMLVVDFEAARFSLGPDLSSFADADGLPDMDQMLADGMTIYLTLQRLDRGTYTSLGNGLVAVIDAANLTLTDVDPMTPGMQAYSLALANPYTRLGQTADGDLLVGCAGDWMTSTSMGLVALDPHSGQSTVIADGATLGGAPSELAFGADRIPWVLVAAPNGLVVDEMRVVRYDGSLTVTASSAGFTLAGLAVDAGETLYFGNRTDGDAAGLYASKNGAEPTGPFATSLPPFAIVTLD